MVAIVRGISREALSRHKTTDNRRGEYQTCAMLATELARNFGDFFGRHFRAQHCHNCCQQNHLRR
jgi:hypothetical protein